MPLPIVDTLDRRGVYSLGKNLKANSRCDFVSRPLACRCAESSCRTELAAIRRPASGAKRSALRPTSWTGQVVDGALAPRLPFRLARTALE
jgi:hypothetical protein